MNFEYIDTLIKNCELAKNIKPNREFEFNNLSDLDNIPIAIYIIEEIAGNIEETFSKLKEYKNKKERNCPKLNNASSTLYVGSSTTGLKKRIKEHIGDGSKSTYSLQLKYWFRGNYKITIKVYDNEISREIIQIIEDNLSHQLKPAFGKQGSNNR
jgi:Uri superfamily endonuclease